MDCHCCPVNYYWINLFTWYKSVSRP